MKTGHGCSTRNFALLGCRFFWFVIDLAQKTLRMDLTGIPKASHLPQQPCQPSRYKRRLPNSCAVIGAAVTKSGATACHSRTSNSLAQVADRRRKPSIANSALPQLQAAGTSCWKSLL